MTASLQTPSSPHFTSSTPLHATTNGPPSSPPAVNRRYHSSKLYSCPSDNSSASKSSTSDCPSQYTEESHQTETTVLTSNTSADSNSPLYNSVIFMSYSESVDSIGSFGDNRMMQNEENNEEWQRWKGGWRKVKADNTLDSSSTPGAVEGVVTPRMANRKQVLQMNGASMSAVANVSAPFDQDCFASNFDEYATAPPPPPVEHFSSSNTNPMDLSPSILSPTHSQDSNFANTVDADNSLANEECRGLDMNDINDIVKAGEGVGAVYPGLRFHPSGSFASDDNHEEEVDTSFNTQNNTINSSGMKTPFEEWKQEKSHSSPQSVMDMDYENSPTLTSFKSRGRRGAAGRETRRKKLIDASSFSDNGSLIDSETEYDDSASYSYNARSTKKGGVKKGGEGKELEQGGSALCCVSQGATLLTGGVACLPDSCSDDETERHSINTEDNIDDYGGEISVEGDGTLDYGDEEARRERAGSNSLESSMIYTTDGKSFIRASTMSSPRAKKQHQQRSVGGVTAKKKHGTPRRGRSLTARHGYNSDRSVSRGSTSPFSDSVHHLQGQKLSEDYDQDISALINDALDYIVTDSADSSQHSVVQSVLSQDQATWMEMTKPSPQRSKSTPTYGRRLNADIGKSGVKKELQKVEDVAKQNAAVLPFMSREANAVEGYFKKLLSVGIQLQLNDSTGQKRQGKIFLRFGGRIGGEFEDPCFIWKDLGGQVSTFSSPGLLPNPIDSICLFDIQSMRKPTKFELDSYPQAIAGNSFFLSTNNGTSLLFEAINDVQIDRVTTGLKGVVSKLVRDIITGDNGWIVQMMTSVGANVLGVDGSASYAMTNVTDQLVKKTLVEEARVMRRKRRALC
eukprot:g11199.t1 g11199   contig5:351146-353860(+)